MVCKYHRLVRMDERYNLGISAVILFHILIFQCFYNTVQEAVFDINPAYHISFKFSLMAVLSTSSQTSTVTFSFLLSKTTQSGA